MWKVRQSTYLSVGSLICYAEEFRVAIERAGKDELSIFVGVITSAFSLRVGKNPCFSYSPLNFGEHV